MAIFTKKTQAARPSQASGAKQKSRSGVKTPTGPLDRRVASDELDMKKFWHIILFLSVASLFSTGCATFRSDNLAEDSQTPFKVSASTNQNPMPLPVEIATDIVKITEGKTPPPIVAAPITVAPVAPATASTEPAVATLTSTNPNQSQTSTDKALPARAPASVKHKNSGQTQIENYAVKPGDTLMKIAFEKYGDLTRWREIYNRNKTKIDNINKLSSGTVLTIEGIEYVVVHKDGRPYLIRRYDTLVKISNKLYGTSAKWKYLWHHNPELIKNPNKIYAGFTLYYEPDPNFKEQQVPVKKQTQLKSIYEAKDRAPTSEKSH